MTNEAEILSYMHRYLINKLERAREVANQPELRVYEAQHAIGYLEAVESILIELSLKLKEKKDE